jgi:hypothetical protein
MSKPIRSRWFLQQMADIEVKRIAPGTVIVPVVQYDDDQIVWSDECEGVGQVAWHCGYILSVGGSNERALVPIFNAAIATWQARYDIGLTRD